MHTFTDLPEPITAAINTILSRSSPYELSSAAKKIHQRYMEREKGNSGAFVQSPIDMQAYLALRSPATYAQITGAFSQIQERIPEWKPKTMLDLGCGPGTGTWSAKTVWPSISTVECVDKENYFLSLGEEILSKISSDVLSNWKKMSIENWIETNKNNSFDLILVANVCNELSPLSIERLIHQLVSMSSGIVVIVEPGSSIGYPVIQTIATLIPEEISITAPYIHNSHIPVDEYWIHFPQKFHRPEFQRRIRQAMRESSFMASDWEESKYSYLAWGKRPQKPFWGQCIGPIDKQKGFVTVPVLTESGIIHQKVLKRNKDQYTVAKNLRWGELIEDPI